ncbi:MAG: phosphate acyltransferase PlsX [Phycisphaerales bacterium]|nr:phosphate acyltransferase PlsX [Phycisphaerales bacterium]
MRIGLDAMGGDHAPREVVGGAQVGLGHLRPGDELVLYGPEEQVAAECRQLGLTDPRVRIVHCPEWIEMKESPVEALRQKRRSSIAVMAGDAAKGELDGLISAGNTGAFAAACHLRLGTIPGVSRPGIAILMPTFYGPVIICDVGANTTPKAHHLVEYAQMCVIYAKLILNIADPRVGLISIGEEEGKGNPLVKEAGTMLKKSTSSRFVGNVEGRDIFGGRCDVAICDGFVGNVILKLTEGLAEGLFKTITHEIKEEAPDLVQRFEPITERIWKRHDFAEYGGAPLLGLAGVAIICHGRSDRRAIGNAVRVAMEQVRHDIKGLIASEFSRRTEVPA